LLPLSATLVFRREDVFAAAQWLNVVEEWRDGQRIWRKPDVLAVLPKWNYSRRADRLRQESHELRPNH
jgi:hypothetical protein